MTPNAPALELLPAVDVQDGQAVRLVQGEAGSATSYGDPVTAALDWQRAGAEWIHLVDLDAAFGRGDNREVMRRVVEEIGLKIELSGKVYDLFSRPAHSADAASFVATALKDRPNAEEVARIRARTEGRLIMVSLKDAAAVSAVLGTASTRGVGFEIAHGGMSATKDSAYGLLTVALTGEPAAVDAFVADLAGAGDVQEVQQ